MAARHGVSIALAALVLSGCTHAPSFERESPRIALGDGPALAPLAPLKLVATTGTDPRFARELERAARANSNVTVVSEDSDADYVVRIAVRREARSSAWNVLVCWPGFVVFAPAWHGLTFPYSLESHVSVLRWDGAPVTEYLLVSDWTARYTSFGYGAAASLGWFAPVLGVPALGSGVTASVEPADTKVLDPAFLAEEGGAWADEIMATIVEAIARDRRLQPRTIRMPEE